MQLLKKTFIKIYTKPFHFAAAAMHGKSKYALVDKIQLTPQEIELFNMFTTFVNEENLNIVLRVAGGWVRDKLLGRNSEDIDIAIDVMTGEEFVKKAKEYFAKKHIEDVHGFGVTKLNPEKSKHLETATIKIKDKWVDFVNLRGETYGDTRVPEIRIGKPEEDAYRRDLTINSLFYNLMTQQVEDFTEKGINDLKDGVIRTPLEPYSTFFDDPLRILRTFRFASRFGFKIESNILECLKSKEILNALRNKVSRERIGKEAHLTMNHASAFDCLTLYYDNNLWDVIFDIEPIIKVDAETIFLKNKIGYDLCKSIYQNFERIEKMKLAMRFYSINESLFYLYLSAATYPYFEIKIEKNKIFPNAGTFIMKESIKFSNVEVQTVSKIVQNINLVKNFVSDLAKNKLKKRNLFEFLRELGNVWEQTFFLSELIEKLTCQKQETYIIIEHNYSKLIDYIYQESMENSFEIKPLIDGTDIIKLLKLKPGPEVKKVLGNILFWQIENLKSDKNDLIKVLAENKDVFLN